MPAARAARTYPAHEEHSSEKITVAVDPYDMGDKAGIFSVNYRAYDYLPVFFVISNDGDQPVALNSMKAELITVDRTKLQPAVVDDLMRRMSHPTASGTAYPLPFPTKKVKGLVSKKAQEEINAAMFAARAVEPHSSASGFLFFDISGISTPLAGATFYLKGLRDARGNELMYFEIPMEKYLSAPPPKP